jgi:hypothetical protein
MGEWMGIATPRASLAPKRGGACAWKGERDGASHPLPRVVYMCHDTVARDGLSGLFGPRLGFALSIGVPLSAPRPKEKTVFPC